MRPKSPSADPVPTARIAILGAGLSGLYAACLLESQGITDYVLLEARDSLGGRIASAAAPGAAAIDRVDLGPTWFWPGYQHELGGLVEELRLALFAQYETGDMLLQRSPHKPPLRRLRCTSERVGQLHLDGAARQIHRHLRHPILARTRLVRRSPRRCLAFSTSPPRRPPLAHGAPASPALPASGHRSFRGMWPGRLGRRGWGWRGGLGLAE